MNILLIDDDKYFIEPLLWELNEQGYNVTYCKSVNDVLDGQGNLKVSKHDCILLDIMMPRGDMYTKRESDAGKDTGLRVLEDIYKQEPNIPIIIVTVRKDLNKTKLQREFGSIKEVICKPVAPSEVVDTIRKILLEFR